MSGQRRSDSNIELVRFFDCHAGDRARAVFAGIQLLYTNNFPNDLLPSSATVTGFTVNNQRGSVEYLRCPLAVV